MSFRVKETGAACGAVVTGLDLRQDLSLDLVAELRAHWVKYKLLIFPDQPLNDHDLERFTLYFGAFGEDPFFGHIDGHEHIAAIQRNADEKTPIFAEFFHSDWSFLDVPPAGTVLYGITIPPHGGNTLFADQVAAYERLPDHLRDKADALTAIHSAELGYAPTGAYGENDRDAGRSMKIIPSEKAREKREHPFVRTHRETGEKALYSSPAYIQGFAGLPKEESDALMAEFYGYQTDEALIYSHKWQKDMLVMWDNRSLLHAATGGYDGHDRLLHRTTIADTVF
ncbi:TauD/TfdA family dioxygenase [Hyphomonas sp. FCG-A18]|uniref:TauD/TfdA dioxygenase family protein n=1 Tax=Hyphomonas sp. FCG-A18 TaxID=3080019 RepID=UPI002B2D0E7B|nr:TauD/TfdA family dioxygenase [Hyphomonas sp. FCG-A18]